MFFQIANELSIKRLVERFKKTSVFVAKDAAKNQMKFQILLKSTAKHASHLFNQKIDQQLIQNENNFDFMKIEKEKTYDIFEFNTSYEITQFDEVIESKQNEFFTSKQNDSTKNQSTRQFVKQRAFNYFNVFISKRTRFEFSNDEDVNKHRNEMFHAMIALLTHEKSIDENDE